MQVNQGLHVYPPAFPRTQSLIFTGGEGKMFRTSVKVVSISLNIWKVWPEVISFPHNCDGRRQQEECVGVEFGRKAGDVSALLSLAGRRRKKKEKLKWKIQSLVWQVRCWWQRCKSQLQCFHKDLSSCFHFFYLFIFFKEPAWSVGWRQQSTCQGFLKWHLSKKYFLQIPLILDCLNREKKKHISQKHEYSGPTPICYVAFPVLTIKTAVQMRIMAGDARGSWLFELRFFFSKIFFFKQKSQRHGQFITHT